jgi:ribonuclease HII
MIGIDEAGRGAWAGPLVVAGCLFTENPGFIRELNDSKQLSKKVRESLESHIFSSTLSHVVVVDAEKIDELGLTACIRDATVEILENLPASEEVMLDGKFNFLNGTKYEDRARVEVKADARYAPVMAASVLAKVARDRIMAEHAGVYPEYGFLTNVGYGTKQHSQSLSKHGLTPIHRRSYKPVKLFESRLR